MSFIKRAREAAEAAAENAQHTAEAARTKATVIALDGTTGDVGVAAEEPQAAP